MLQFFRKTGNVKALDKSPEGVDVKAPGSEMGHDPQRKGERAADMGLSFREDLHRMGYEAARKEHDTRPNAATLEALDAMAESMALSQATRIFDVDTHVEDRLRQERYDQAVQHAAKVGQQIAVSEDEVRRREDALAELGEIPRPPLTPWGILVVGGLFIALTVAPTFHDFIFANLRDPRHAWAASILSGFAIGGFFAWCLLGTARNTTARRVAHGFGLLAGLMMGLGLCAVRIIGVHSFGPLILAIGLALLEVAAVLLLDWIGRGLRHRHAEYETLNAEYQRRLRLLQAAQRTLDYQKSQRVGLVQSIEDFQNYVGWRNSHSNVQELVADARRTIRAGYLMGVSENAAQLYRQQ